MCLNFEILKEGVLMNNKNYGLNFNCITLRVKNIEKMRDYYLKFEFFNSFCGKCIIIWLGKKVNRE